MLPNQQGSRPRYGSNGAESAFRDLVSNPTELDEMGLVQISLGTSAAGNMLMHCHHSRRILEVNVLAVAACRLATQVPSP